MKKLKTVVLAAGAGTRMKSKKAKVLHTLSGKTLLSHVLNSAKLAGSDEIAVIVGHQSNEVIKELNDEYKYFLQEEQLGTGHAVMQAEDFLDDDSIILVLNGDAPLTPSETIEQLFKTHLNSGNFATVLTAELENPTGYGRIITKNGQIEKIVEEKDATEQEKLIKEVNSGIYCFNGDILKEALTHLNPNNNQNELYLTDVIEIIKDKGLKAGTYKVNDSDEIAAVNSRRQLAEAEEILRNRVNNFLMDNGVTIIDPKNTYIDSSVKIGIDTVIYPGCHIQDNTVIGENCIIGMNSHIINSIIEDNVEIENSTIRDSYIESNVKMGPYVNIRPDSRICKNVKIGDFVEIKNSTIKDNSKVPHLSYIGDSEIGKNVNIGCGTVFVNYDGKNKFRSIVGDDVFIGCNANIIAPIKVEDNSFIAAGSTITKDVPKDTLAIARAKQINKEGYVFKLPYKKGD